MENSKTSFKSVKHVMDHENLKIQIEEGEDSNKSKFTVSFIERDKMPNKAIIFCHGYRPGSYKNSIFFLYNKKKQKENTKRETGFHPTENLHLNLMKDGWLLAATSYRRDGHIPREEAIDDVVDSLSYQINQLLIFYLIFFLIQSVHWQDI